MTTSKLLLSLEKVWYAPKAAKRYILQGINLEIYAGEIILLIGPSGSGKTTLLKVMRGLIPHVTSGTWKGTVKVKGKVMEEKDLFKLARYFGHVFQEPEFQVVGKNVLHELAFTLEILGWDVDQLMDRVLDVASHWNLLPLSFKPPHHLSGGELRLLTLASAFISEPSILLCDELLSFLDQENRQLVFQTMRKIIQRNDQQDFSIIIATHDLQDFLPLATRLIYMEEGKIIRDGPPTDVLEYLLTSRPTKINIPSYYLMEQKLGPRCPETAKLSFHSSAAEKLEWCENILSCLKIQRKMEENHQNGNIDRRQSDL